jgi:hypothetical protein
LTIQRLAIYLEFRFFGAVAQLGERLNGIQEVVGSIPISSTNIPTLLIDTTLTIDACETWL